MNFTKHELDLLAMSVLTYEDYLIDKREKVNDASSEYGFCFKDERDNKRFAELEKLYMKINSLTCIMLNEEEN